MNQPTPPDQLPQLDDMAFVPVDPRHLQISLVGFGLAIVAVAVAAAVVAAFTSATTTVLLAVFGGASALLLVLAVLKVLEVRNLAYQVRTHDLSYRRGVLFKSVSTIPFVRVQHARIQQGPIQRRFGLASLEVNSAGPDLAIHGLRADTAERLKVLVVQRAGESIETE